jgi:hypothetical protein
MMSGHKVRVLGLLLVLGQPAFAADAPDNSIISYTERGEVIHRTLTPNGKVTDQLPYAEGEVLVRFKDSVSPTRRASAHQRLQGAPIKRFSHVRNLEHVKLPRGMSVEQAIRSYRSHPDVLYAEPNYIVETLGVPNDPSFPSQWNLQNTGQNGGTPGADIKAVQAWNITTGSSDVVVAVIDTGVDYNHVDLAGNIWRNDADCNNNGIDDDGNGYIDDCYGIDTFNHDSDPMDDNDHGTHVAGIIGAVGNNSLGIVGVNWNVKIMPCKFIGSQGYGFLSGAIACLDYVKAMKDRGVNIVATNNSWGSYYFSQALADAIDAQRESGLLFVAAPGNDGVDYPSYPDAFYLSNIISVAATDQLDDLAFYSNYGSTTVHVGAPGNLILSTTAGNTYKVFSGTSMAAPHVAGLAALLKAQVPGRDWKTIKNLILTSGDKLASTGPIPVTWKRIITDKRINALRSLTCSNSPVLARLRPSVDQTAGDINIGTPVNLSAIHINCGAPNGEIDVVVVETGERVRLHDDGRNFDQVAGDGIYSGQWLPSAGGTFTLEFPDGDSFKVEVDSDLKPGFPAKAYTTAIFYQDGPAVHALVGNIDSDPNPEIVVSAGQLYAYKSDGSVVPGWPVDDNFGAGYPAMGELSKDSPGLEVFSGYLDIGEDYQYHAAMGAYSGTGAPLPGWPQLSQGLIRWPSLLIDIDGDGVDEIFVPKEGSVYGYRADGSPLPGWPVTVGGEFVGMLAAADLDGDGRPEIVFGANGKLYAYHDNGSTLTGFPVSGVWSGYTVIGDVDGDGVPEIIVQGFVYGHTAVVIYSSFGFVKRTIDIGYIGNFRGPPALADLDGDGIPEIIIQTEYALTVVRGDGSTFPGWPVVFWAEGLGGWENSAPAVGDVDGDGLPDIVITTGIGGSGIWAEIRAYNRTGAMLPNFPKRRQLGYGAVPAIADLDLDGRNEIIVTTDLDWFGDYYKVWVYDLGGPSPHGAVQWSQLMGGPKHHGFYAGGFSVPQRAILRITTKGTKSGTVTGGGVDCGKLCSRTYDPGTTITLVATPAPGSTFTGWKDGGCSGTGPCTLKIDSDTFVTAIFGDIMSLKVGTMGPGIGEVFARSGIHCGTDCEEDYNANEYHNIYAAYAAGSKHLGWIWPGGGEDCTYIYGGCSTRAGPSSLTAVFGLTSLASVVVAKRGTGDGTITNTINSTTCRPPCVQNFPFRTVVTINAVPGENSSFSGWQQNPSPRGNPCTGITSCQLSNNSDTWLLAVFDKILSLVSPFQGAVWRIGKTQQIQWGYSGRVDASTVRIDLSRDGGQTWTPITKNIRNGGLATWKVKGPASKQAKIRVCNVRVASGCETSGTFTIQ